MRLATAADAEVNGVVGEATRANATIVSCATCLDIEMVQEIIVNHHFTRLVAKTEEVFDENATINYYPY